MCIRDRGCARQHSQGPHLLFHFAVSAPWHDQTASAAHALRAVRSSGSQARCGVAWACLPM
eukprot:2937997-Alexandrium_andersonii.AAC.1